MKKPVCKDDPTTHGGVVKTASSTFTLDDGRRVALVNDIVTCPEHGDNPIIEGGEGYSEDGRKIVVHHCRTRCGSLVIATNTGMSIT